MDFDRYLRCVEVPSDDQSLIHYSSCPAFTAAVFVSSQPHPPEERCRRRSCDSPTCMTCKPKKISSAPRHVSVYELRRRLDGCAEQRSCLRSPDNRRGRSPIRQSVQNHWAWSHDTHSSSLARCLGKSLTLHSSPRIKRRATKKQVKFADQQGETLATFSLVPKAGEGGDDSMDEEETGYWSFIQQTLYEQDCEDEEPITGWPSVFDVDDEEPSASTSSSSCSEDVDDSPSSEQEAVVTGPTCSLCFEQPAANMAAFKDKMEQLCVGLENVKVDTEHNVVTCTIKVKNLDGEKRVFARCTRDAWRTFADLAAEYVNPGYEDSVLDTFFFSITRPLAADNFVRVEFAICYQVNGRTYWDNNQGLNYAIEWSERRDN